MAHGSMDWRERGGSISLTKVVLIGSVALLFGLLAARGLSHDRQPRAVEELGPALAAAPKLPAEWVLEREAVTFDHMFRSKRPAVE